MSIDIIGIDIMDTLSMPNVQSTQKLIISSVHEVQQNGSLRTTIPSKVAQQLGIEKGDKLQWYWEEKGGKKFAMFKRMES